MTTALDLCTSAALKIGALEDGESLTAQEGTDCLAILNSMLDYWALNKLLVYQILQSTYSWPSATTSRTIGTAGNFTPRPIRIEDGSFFRDGTIDYPVEVVRNREVYDAIVSKSDQGIPDLLFYDPAFPLGVLYAYPVPNKTLSLLLNTWQVLQNFALLTTDLALPPGYQWLIEHNLAIPLGPVFSLPIPDDVRAEARSSKATIERLNNLPLYGSTDVAAALGAGQRSNILTG